MKKTLKPLVAVAMLATVALAANVENPLYAPAQFGFYSKTGFSFMYKQSDANLAMKAKDWEYRSEYILRGYEDFGFGITDRFALRGAFGYTHDFSIERSGPHNARLGLGYRAINQPVEAVVWDIYMDAWLGGISKMKANLIASTSKLQNIKDSMPLSFKYDNYANGRWGIWLGTSVGKTFDKFTLSAFGEIQKTFGNNNNEIKIDEDAKLLINGLVYKGVYTKALANLPTVIAGVCQQQSIPQAACNKETLGEATFGAIEEGAKNYLKNAALDTTNNYIKGLPSDFNVDTKGVWDYVVGLKTFYEINDKWSVGEGFTWRHRGTNSVEKLNIKNSGTLSDKTKEEIAEGVADNFVGSMEDGVEEFTLTLSGSRNITKNLQFTLFGECTFDIAEDKAQLGSDIRTEVGLRMNWQF